MAKPALSAGSPFADATAERESGNKTVFSFVQRTREKV